MSSSTRSCAAAAGGSNRDTDDHEEDEADDDDDRSIGEEGEEEEKKKSSMKRVLDSLHREMDVASYSKTAKGQYRRVTPKNLSKGKTRKRKLLEREDHEMAEPLPDLEDLEETQTHGKNTNDDHSTDLMGKEGGDGASATGNSILASSASDNKRKRLRGSRLALEDEVVEASMPITNLMVAKANAKYNQIQKIHEQQKQTQKDQNDEKDLPLEEEEDEQEEQNEEPEEPDNDQDQANDNDNDDQEDPVEEDENDEDDDDEDAEEEEEENDTEPQPMDKTLPDTNSHTTQESSTTTTTTTNPSSDTTNKVQKKKRGPYKKRAKTNKKPRQQNANSQKARRRLFRLKNFKSYKMAQRHGQALGAHARGLPKLAIARLQQIAKDAPSAPQVYSSLGMVYTDMYQTCWKKFNPLNNNIKQDSNQSTPTQPQDKPDTEATQDEETTPTQEQPPKDQPNNKPASKKVHFALDQETSSSEQQQSQSAQDHDNESTTAYPEELREAIDLAQKAYGSYHIAAILCKKDYSLWVRAADTAVDIADLYQLAATYNNNQLIDDLTRKEQERWFTEAKGDLQTADNLKPPTLDVPIKLARLYVELGCLSEAITLWMDLLQRQRQKKEFRHNAWMLYADCMLRIGYECQEWNTGRGQERQQNYMFRRWLRKFSHKFDWQERRLQGLVLALAAAAGTKATGALMEWMRQRALQRHLQKMATMAKEQAAVDFALALVQGDDDDEEDEKDENDNSKDASGLDETTDKTDNTDEKDRMEDGGDEETNGDTRTTEAAEATNNSGSSADDSSKEGENEVDSTTNQSTEMKDEAETETAAATDDKGETRAALDTAGEKGESAEEHNPTQATAGDSSDDDSDDSVPIAKLKEQYQQTRLEPDTSMAREEDHSNDKAETGASLEDHDVPVGRSTKEAVADTAEVDDEYDQEKRFLLESNASELAAFDQTTEQMMEVLGKGSNDEDGECASGSQEAIKERKEARRKMTRYHRAQVKKLATEYQKKDDSADDQTPEKQQKDEEQEGGGENEDLAMASSDGQESPVAASCRVVTQIATELMKLLLEMKLYRGGRLAGEAVSLYMRERARIHDKKVEQRRILEQQSDPLARLFSSQPPTYDDVQQDADFSDEEEAAATYLSDDENLESETVGPRLLQSLRRGALPPEVSVLFSLCLIHEGGRNYVAKKCMDMIDQLEPEGKGWVSDTATTKAVSKDADWQLYRASATDSLGRIAAYSLVAETLTGSGKDTEWASHFAPMFQKLVDYLEDNGLICAPVETTSFDSMSSRFRIRQILKCITSLGRLQVKSAHAAYFAAIKSYSKQDIVDAKVSILQSIKLLRRHLRISSAETLLVDANGAISKDFVEVLKIFDEGYSVIVHDDDFPLDKSKLEELADEGNQIVSWMSLNTAGLLSSGGQSSTLFDSTAWDSIPLPSTWQSVHHKAMSLRCYNLCISFNVSHFSGWEPHEFSLRLMKSASCTFFGLKVNNGRVAGFLPEDLETELERQWKSLGDFLPAAADFKFNIRLAQTKQSSWYKEGLEKHKEATEDEPISVYAEHEGLHIVLAHSMLCLELARQKETHERYELLMSSLSVLLPITQFYLNQHIWDSDVGKATAMDVAANFMNQVYRKRLLRDPSSRTRKRRPPKEPAKPLDEWFPGEDRANPLSNTVSIPSSELQRLWGIPTDFSRKIPTQFGGRQMKKVHDAMEQLRVCYTDTAVEKASLQVACALLDLAQVNNTCENPFLVIQQAAIFAGHGTKRGNSVDLFREPLPEPSKCLPYEALVILGRADCFQAVYFPYEAAFLCAYVARVCNMHREAKSAADDDGGNMQPENENDNKICNNNNNNRVEAKAPSEAKDDEKKTKSTWSNQWMIVGVLCYNVSIMIRATAADKTVGIKTSRTEESFAPWDQDVVDELLLARADAVAWKSSLGQEETNFSFENCSKKDYAYEDETALFDEGDDADNIADENGVEGSGGDAEIPALVATGFDTGAPMEVEQASEAADDIVTAANSTEKLDNDMPKEAPSGTKVVAV
ncbi:expressed unknown protein [Seminavis robusta]|uniref:Uncharacterized protein n=1 Tax=Seminavis robusta TaxID=568900 RepID=A0A9N8D9P4_9STRA|nr:expressed unknown protein [Seminavis robusta]|eukprot:Sro48_g028120.1 n/a (2024) ;mRNA; r:25401-31849